VDYIELRQFLEDTGNVARASARRCRKHSSMKVNTAFNGEFAANDKCAIRSINTKNSEIYRFARMVIELTLASLEEFQECDSGRCRESSTCQREQTKFHACRISHRNAARNYAEEGDQCEIHGQCMLHMVAALYPAEKNVNRN